MSVNLGGRPQGQALHLTDRRNWGSDSGINLQRQILHSLRRHTQCGLWLGGSGTVNPLTLSTTAWLVFRTTEKRIPT